MEDTCAYCGEEVLAERYRHHDQVFCCQECMDAATEDSLDYLDAAGYDDL